VKTNASSGGVDATEKEKVAAVLRQLFFEALGFSLLSMAGRSLERIKGN